MNTGEVFQFDHPQEIFVRVFDEKCRRNPLFSVRAWSRHLGFRNPSQVADVLKGRRNLTVEFGLRVSDALGLSHDEKIYFESLVYRHNAKDGAERAYFSNVVNRLRPQTDKKAINADSYALVKEWYYGVLDEMTCLADFKADPQYLAKRLGPEITPQAVAVALADLLRIGSIEKNAKGKLSRPRKVYFRTDPATHQREDSWLRKYQRRFIEKSLNALEEQTKGESFFRMTNIPIKLAHFEELRSRIEDFVQEMGKLESPKDADEVYQLGIQFCRITQKLPKGKAK